MFTNLWYRIKNKWIARRNVKRGWKAIHKHLDTHYEGYYRTDKVKKFKRKIEWPLEDCYDEHPRIRPLPE